MRPGERIGDYTIVSKIGEGGMSVVYLAHQVTDETPVIVKELREQYRFNQQLIERFLREATILQDLRHPHLARVFGLLEHDGKHYMIQEYLSGGSLADLLRKQMPYTEEEAIGWCCDALRAMNYAHENGIVHRDLKPSNLMLDDRRRIRVIDFGIARAFGKDRLTRTSDGSIGTLEYMSPEQILTPDKIDHLTDVYSMGIVLYELLTGALPFDGPTPFAVQEKIARQPPPPLKELGRNVAPLEENATAIESELANIVYRAIEKRADRRFGGCAEFALCLDRYLLRRTGPAPVPVPEMDAARTGWGRSARHATIAAGCVLVLVLTFLLGTIIPDIVAGGEDEGNGTGARAEDVVPTPDPTTGPPERIPDPVPASDNRPEQTSDAARQEELKADAERQARLKAEADRQAHLKADADRRAQLKADADRQAQLKADADRQAQLKADADRQAQLKADADRQARLKSESQRQAQLKAEAERQAQLKAEAERQAQLKAEADRQAQLKADADRQAQLKAEADRKARLDAQVQQLARFAESVSGTWRSLDEQTSGSFRTRTEQVLTIGPNCAGQLNRTVKTYERGFAGWREQSSEPSSYTFRCDANGRVTGDLSGQLSPQGGVLLFNDTRFTRK